jgi:four helix bundle protein
LAEKFTDLVCWQRADELRRLIFEITAQPHVARDFKYCDQSKDAARSAASNIAEGFGRFRHKEFANFLEYAIGSLSELLDLLIDGRERGYVSDLQPARGKRLIVRAKSVCVALKAYLRRTPDRGS